MVFWREHPGSKVTLVRWNRYNKKQLCYHLGPPANVSDCKNDECDECAERVKSLRWKFNGYNRRNG